jgi:hypothetical protein
MGDASPANAVDKMRPIRRLQMTLRRALLVCGVVSSLLYVGIDLFAAIGYGEYHSFASQTISELSARGAPTKPIVDPLLVFYGLLAIAFGVGVWMSARGKRALRITAGLLIAYGMVGLPGPWVFPMNVRGSGDVGGDVPHIVLTGVIVLLIIAAVAAGAFSRGPAFCLYSWATLVTILVFGALAGIEARGIATGEPTPSMGLTERVHIGAFLLWVAALALSLLRGQRRSATSSSRPGGEATIAA